MNPWLRAIRIRFLLASVISVSNGLALAYLYNGIDVIHALLTYLGILALHASVDLLNDYWDYKRGIDKITKRTPFSGGTGVLPEGLLKPRDVYRLGVIMLIVGAVIGSYFIAIKGVIIAVLLAFAIVSIYFYTTKIVNAGLGELFVAIKGSMIVLGTFYIQTDLISIDAIYNSIIIGLLSSIVLFINSFPDHDADKAKGRKTLVIILGKAKASRFFIIFPILIYGLLVVGVALSITPIYALLTFITFPYMLSIIKGLIAKHDADINTMSNTIKFSRLFGLLLLLAFIMEALLI